MAVMHEQRPEGTSDALDEVRRPTAAHRALALLRIGFGFTFLWAFLDKTFALGFHTGAVVDPETGAREGIDFFAEGQAWANGGSPTEGFLSFGVPAHNPFGDFWASIAGDAWADWLFMAGLLGLGLALTFGFGMRIAAATGALLYLMMYAAVLPLDNNPLIDDHILGAISVVVLALTYAGDTWGVGRHWARTGLVRKYPVLR